MLRVAVRLQPVAATLWAAADGQLLVKLVEC